MLRHKRIINFSLKSFKSSNVRSFHVTYSSFMRRVVSSRIRYPEINSEPEEPAVAGNFIAQPLKSICNNFYGIESDEGVILIEDKLTTLKSPHTSFIDRLASKKLSENFKKTSFGKVRLDNENKLTIHGQFEESTSLSDVEDTIRATQLKKFAIEDSETNASPYMEDTQMYRNDSQNLSHFPGTINQRESDVKRPKVNFSETKNDISLIDELYFPDKMLQNQESDSIEHANPLVNEKNISYIDEHDFSNKPIEENTNRATSFVNENGSYGKYDGSLHKEPAFTEKTLGYIDQSYFGTIDKNMNTKENAKFTSERDLDSELENYSQTENVSSTTKKENISFIDECFFDKGLESKVVEKKKKHSIKNLKYPEISICPDNLKENNNDQIYNENELAYKSSTEINMKCNEDKNQNYNRGTQSLNTIEEENLYYNSLDLNRQDDTFMKGASSFKNSNFTYKEAMKESLNSGINPKTIPDIDLTKKYLKDEKLNQTTLQNNKISEKAKGLNEKDKQGIQEEHPETAFDFVKKFRGDEKVTYHESISGFSNAPKEKLDSKGMRILKYQVPQLKYFTRDEMLELLAKNVLYSDDDVVVLNKPYNLVMHDSKTTKDACLSKYLDDFAGVLDKNNKNPKLLTVHRLDKETTGCLLLARNDVSAQKLKSLFAQRKIVKTYWIVTIRVPDPLQGIIDIPITEGIIDKKARMVLHPDLPKDIAYKNHSKRGKNAVTHYNVISESGNAALVEVKPETGIKHQIRVHFGLGLSCPILGDNKYSYPDKFVPQKLSNDMLHRLQVQQSKVRHIPMHIYARSIFIPQYTTGRNLFVMAPMPIHMSKNLQRLKFKK